MLEQYDMYWLNTAILRMIQNQTAILENEVWNKNVPENDDVLKTQKTMNIWISQSHATF
jgi:hypothetical protein